MLILEATTLHKSYRDRGKPITAVNGVSLSLAAGEVLAFLGPNGAGKTTTIKMIAGLIIPDTGQVKVMGRDPHRHPEVLHHIGAVLEGNRNIYWRLTPLENLEYFGVLRGMTRRAARLRAQELLDRFELTAKTRTPTQGLSRGMQQKLAIAVALMHEPQLLLLDEPTLGLDVAATETVKTLVRQIAQTEGRAILLTTHQLDIAEELSDRVAIIRQGQIIAESATSDLIRQFSAGTYRIETAASIDADRQAQLATLGAVTQNLTSKIQLGMQVHLADPSSLYAALDILKPLPLLRVEQEQASLTDIFLELVHSQDPPEPASPLPLTSIPG
jgi:ABC-2 type transport system ATP-binding protein